MKRRPSEFKLSPAQRRLLRLRMDGYDLSDWHGKITLYRPLRPTLYPRRATLVILVREGFLYKRRLTVLRGLERYYLTAAGKLAAQEVL